MEDISNPSLNNRIFEALFLEMNHTIRAIMMRVSIMLGATKLPQKNGRPSDTSWHLHQRIEIKQKRATNALPITSIVCNGTH